MHFVVRSGTEIREIEEKHDRPEAALDRILQLRKRRRPNIRILDAQGRRLSPYDLWKLAAPELRPSLPDDWKPSKRPGIRDSAPPTT